MWFVFFAMIDKSHSSQCQWPKCCRNANLGVQIDHQSTCDLLKRKPKQILELVVHHCYSMLQLSNLYHHIPSKIWWNASFGIHLHSSICYAIVGYKYKRCLVLGLRGCPSGCLSFGTSEVWSRSKCMEHQPKVFS